jgi:TonB family protein
MMSRTHTFVVVGMMVVGWAVQQPQAAQGQQVQAQIEPVPARTIHEFAGTAAHVKTAGVTLPKLLRQVHPKYTPDAMRAKVQGQVKLFAIVGVDGRIERSQVNESLHPDLDAEAIRTLAQWQFEPGRLDGTPVRVAIEVQMEFRLHRD